MSTSDEGPGGTDIFLPAGELAGSIDTLYAFDAGSLFDDVTDVDGALRLIDDLKASAGRTLEADLASQVDALWDEIGSDIQSGELKTSQVSDFFRWLRFDKGVSGLTAVMVTGGALAGYVLRYAEAHGYSPPEPSTTPPAALPVVPGIEVGVAAGTAPEATTAPPVLPDHVAKVVKSAAITIGNQDVPAPGLTPAEAAAISNAIGLAMADALTVLHQTVYEMLPGLRPGQVPEALDDLNRATTVLERQYAVLKAQVGTRAEASVAGRLEGAQQTITRIDTELKHLQAQLAEEEESNLGTHVNHVATRTETVTKTVTTVVEEKIPDIGTGLAALAGSVSALTTQVEAEIVPQLEAVTATADGNAGKLALTTDECLADLCDAENNVTEPIKQGGATPSLLKQLGNLLKGAFELGFIATVMETVVTLLDAKLEVSAVVSDTATIAGWAESAAGVIEGDLSWWGGLPSE